MMTTKMCLRLLVYQHGVSRKCEGFNTKCKNISEKNQKISLLESSSDSGKSSKFDVSSMDLT